MRSFLSAIAASWRRCCLRHRFWKAFTQKSLLLADDRFKCRWKDRLPCLDDATGATGFDAHYVYHTAWAARTLVQLAPQHHIDIGSCLRFVTILSAFMPVSFYDYRPAKITLNGLACGYADLLQLPFADNSIPSLSCMHVAEHIGLERYGDHFDPKGDLKAMAELARVLAHGGHLLFVVPVSGTARIQYNAHRIYTYDQILQNFSSLRLESFALITGEQEYVPDAGKDLVGEQRYGCGCFLFKNV